MIVVSLTTRAVVLGRYLNSCPVAKLIVANVCCSVYAWREHTSQLGWFGEWPAYPTEAIYPRPPHAYGAYPQMYGMQGNYVQQAPGHSVVIQPGVNGGLPMITQVPGMVSA